MDVIESLQPVLLMGRRTDGRLQELSVDGHGGLVPGGNSGLPYGADNYTVAYYGSTNNPQMIVYKRGSTVLKTRTLTYAASGAADNDKLTASVDA